MAKRAEYQGVSRQVFWAAASQVGARNAALEISELLGITRSAISSKLRGLIPWKAAEVQKIAKWLGVSVGALFEESIGIPVMGDVAANPAPEVTYDITDEPEEYLNLPQNMYSFTVRDGSMVPLARPGQRVLVDPGAEIKSGDLAVANIREGQGEGAWLFKRYERQKVGKGIKAILVSIAEGFPPLVLPDHSVKLWKVVGLWLDKAPRWAGPRE
jgi:SOS-response transcriptional repressor LexA